MLDLKYVNNAEDRAIFLTDIEKLKKVSHGAVCECHELMVISMSPFIFLIHCIKLMKRSCKYKHPTTRKRKQNTPKLTQAWLTEHLRHTHKRKNHPGKLSVQQSREHSSLSSLLCTSVWLSPTVTWWQYARWALAPQKCMCSGVSKFPCTQDDHGMKSVALLLHQPVSCSLPPFCETIEHTSYWGKRLQPHESQSAEPVRMFQNVMTHQGLESV